MPYEESRTTDKPHSLSIENRERMSLSGVEDVSGFDENTVILTTSLGALTIRGDGLHIGRIDLELGQLEVQGRVGELSYDEPVQRESLWTRLFG